jgi:small-conductance mechanosensitive channel
LVGTILGGAGVIGLAIGFAVRDTLENYISSIMLSIRQPFRANDHVVINEHEGKVARLTSRATVLMTLDGNHLRIPNSAVFKAVILNYTRNPERRFEFDLGVDADDDPVAAMQVGMDALCNLPFVLNEPEPNAIITDVGDSNIIIRFMAWIDQRDSDFGKSRSLAIRAAKTVLEEQGFTLPEPIYRLRVDQSLAWLSSSTEMAGEPTLVDDLEPKQAAKPEEKSELLEAEVDMDVSPDKHLEEKVDLERAMSHEEDLLDNDRPVE